MSATPPHNLEAERAVLGAALQDSEAAALAVAGLHPSDFYLDAHQSIFRAVLGLSLRKEVANLVSVYSALRQSVQGEEIAATYLSDLVDAVLTTANVKQHLRLVRQDANRRRLIAASRRMVDRAMRNGDDPSGILADFWEETRAIEAEESPASLPVLDPPMMVLRQLRNAGSPVPTGIAPLNNRLRAGMRSGRALVAGGTAGVGKTAFVIQMGVAAERANCAVAILCSDEGREPGIIRLGQQHGFDRELLEIGHEPTFEALGKELEGRTLSFPDPDGKDGTLEGVTEALVHADPTRPKVVIVDSIQTVRTRRPPTDFSSLRERIMWNARTARRLAVEHNLVRIYTSEMNRGWYRAKKEEDRASDLAAFAEARIEYAGDVLLAMRSSDEDPDLVTIRIAKNRLGDRTPFLLRLDRKRALFVPVNGEAGASAAAEAAKRQVVDETLERILRPLKKTPDLTSRQLLGLVRGKTTIFYEALDQAQVKGMVDYEKQGKAIVCRLAEVPT
jgi:replicative DNA helicase